MTATKFLGAETAVDKWQRLAPAAMIHFAVQFVGQFIKQGIQGLLPLGAVILTAGENRWFIVTLIGIAVIVALLVGAVLSYLKFRFRLAGDTFLIQKGVLKRKRLSLTYDRIQNVAFKQPLYFRPFDLVVLGIESAGSSGEEVNLGGIPRSLAEEIRSTIFARRADKNIEEKEGVAEAEALESSSVEEIIRQPISELVRYGLSNNNIWVFAGITAGALGQLDWDDYSFLAGSRDYLEQIADQGRVAAALVAVSGFVGVVALLLSVSVVGAIITYYKYHLTRSDGRFHRTTGLFERKETSLPESKVQSLSIRQGWPARLLGRYHLILRQVGFSGPGESGNSGNNKLLVPSVTLPFANEFSKILYPDFDWSGEQLKEIDTSFTRKMVLWIILPIVMLPTTALSFAIGPLSFFLLLIPLLLTPVVMLRRKRYGFATDGKHGIIRSGFIGYKLTLFCFYKVQTVRLWQSPGQRRKGLASLTIKLAGFSLDVPYMQLAEAQAWRDRILFEVEKHEGKWM